jgi:hypothetical protein
MDWMLDRWDVALLVVTCYVAVMTLVRMMARRRDQVVTDVERQIQAYKKRAKPVPPAKPKNNRDAV